jgi:hypothetical protein
MVDAERSWLRMAAENFLAARVAFEDERFRACVNRAYFTMYQSAMSLMLHAGLQPPARGNWDHYRLTRLFEDRSVRTLLARYPSRPKAILFKRDLLRTFHLRCQADCRPEARMDRLTCRQALRLAGTFLTLAEEIATND